MADKLSRENCVHSACDDVRFTALAGQWHSRTNCAHTMPDVPNSVEVNRLEALANDNGRSKRNVSVHGFSSLETRRKLLPAGRWRIVSNLKDGTELGTNSLWVPLKSAAHTNTHAEENGNGKKVAVSGKGKERNCTKL